MSIVHYSDSSDKASSMVPMEEGFRSLQNNASPLLRLPGEIRNKIYRSVIAGSEISFTDDEKSTIYGRCIETSTLVKGHTTTFAALDTSYNFSSSIYSRVFVQGKAGREVVNADLLRTCRTIKDEAASCFFSAATLVLRGRHNARNAPLEFETGFIRHLKLRIVDVFEWTGLLDSFNHLETLTLDIDFDVFRSEFHARFNQKRGMSLLHRTLIHLCHMPAKRVNITFFVADSCISEANEFTARFIETILEDFRRDIVEGKKTDDILSLEGLVKKRMDELPDRSLV